MRRGVGQTFGGTARFAISHGAFQNDPHMLCRFTGNSNKFVYIFIYIAHWTTNFYEQKIAARMQLSNCTSTQLVDVESQAQTTFVNIVLLSMIAIHTKQARGAPFSCVASFAAAST